MTYVAAIVVCIDVPEARNRTEAQIYGRQLADKILQESERPLVSCDLEDVYDVEDYYDEL